MLNLLVLNKKEEKRKQPNKQRKIDIVMYIHIYKQKNLFKKIFNKKKNE